MFSSILAASTETLSITLSLIPIYTACAQIRISGRPFQQRIGLFIHLHPLALRGVEIKYITAGFGSAQKRIIPLAQGQRLVQHGRIHVAIGR